MVKRLRRRRRKRPRRGTRCSVLRRGELKLRKKKGREEMMSRVMAFAKDKEKTYEARAVCVVLLKLTGAGGGMPGPRGGLFGAVHRVQGLPGGSEEEGRRRGGTTTGGREGAKAGGEGADEL